MSHGDPRTQEEIGRSSGRESPALDRGAAGGDRPPAAAARPLQLRTLSGSCPQLLSLSLVAYMIADPGLIGPADGAPPVLSRTNGRARGGGAASQAVVLTVELVGGNKALNSADALLSVGGTWCGWRRSSRSASFSTVAGRRRRTGGLALTTPPKRPRPGISQAAKTEGRASRLAAALFLDYLYLSPDQFHRYLNPHRRAGASPIVPS